MWWKRGKVCSVGFQSSVPAVAQAACKPACLLMLFTDRQSEKKKKLFIPVDVLSLLLLVATVFPPQLTAGYLITTVPPAPTLCCVCGELAENLGNSRGKS